MPSFIPCPECNYLIVDVSKACPSCGNSSFLTSEAASEQTSVIMPSSPSGSPKGIMGNIMEKIIPSSESAPVGMENESPIYKVGAVGDTLLVYDDRVVIQHKGVLNLFTQGIKGDKTIYYIDITSVQFKKFSTSFGIPSAGYIQFSLAGGFQSGGGVLDAMSDENAVAIAEADNETAEEVYKYILGKIKEAKQPKASAQILNVTSQASSADEILKFKSLLDNGVITADEFEAQKKRLLGM